MAGQTQLADASVFINDDLVSIVPGSLKTKVANGEIKSRALATGGANYELVHGLDVETLIDVVSFSIANTDVGQNLVEDWKQRSIDGTYNVIRLTWPGQDVVKVYKYAAMNNSPDPEHSADGNIDVEFSGKQSVS